MNLRSIDYKWLLSLLLLLGLLLFFGCKEDDETIEPPSTVFYKLDGRTVKLGDPSPIALDLSGDGQVDFTIFMELTANNQGDRLYAGVNPIGPNLVKSGPPIDENFLSMGFVVAESAGSIINLDVEANEQWTNAHSALVVRNTFTNGEISYEGNWANGERIVAIQNIIDGSVYFGWLRLKYDRITEVITLIDFAYESTPGRPIVAGF